MKLIKIRIKDSALQQVKLIKVRCKDDEDFSEKEHPRATKGPHAGQFVAKGKGKGSGNSKGKEKEKTEPRPVESTQKAKKISRKEQIKKFTPATRTPAEYDKDGKVTKKAGPILSPDGKEAPEHIQSIGIPPGYHDVVFNPDKSAELWAHARDDMGRPIRFYNPELKNRNKAIKFARVANLDKEYDTVKKQNDQAVKEGNPAALALRLVMLTGIRPSSETDTKAKVKSYGATTLLGEHIIKNEDGSVNLKFTGKSGKENNLHVTDKELVKYLQSKAGKPGKVFPVNERRLSLHSKSLGAGGYDTKDFRTLLANRIAMKKIKEMPAPTNEEEYKKSVKEVCKASAAVLGNTGKVCLDNYINEAVFADWQGASGQSNSKGDAEDKAGPDADRMPHVFYGSFDTEKINWRKYSSEDDKEEEEVDETPEDVVAIVGYSSKELWPDEE